MDARLATLDGPILGNEVVIRFEVFIHHSFDAEPLLEVLPYLSAVQIGYPLDRLHGFVDRVDDEPRNAVLYHLRHRTTAVCDDRGTRRHRLDHDQPEGLRPVDRKEHRQRSPEEFFLFLASELTQKFDERMIHLRANDLLEVRTVDRMYV